MSVVLDRNENNFGPAPACLEVLRRAGQPVLSAYTRVHLRGVKSLLSERLALESGVPESRVLLGNGAEELLKLAVHTFLPRGGKLMLPGLSWWYYAAMAGDAGGTTVGAPLTRMADRYVYDADAMIGIFRRERPSLVLLGSPNNPTGNSIAQADLERLLEAFHGTPVVVDQAYWSAAAAESVRTLVDRFPHLMVVRTFSKYYALAGVRIGFAFIGDELRSLALLTRRVLGFSRLGEELALAALDSPGYYADIAKRMGAAKELYYGEVGGIPGVTVFRSDANFVLVEVPAGTRDALRRAMEESGVVLKYMDEPQLPSHLRITIGTEEENRRVIGIIRDFFRR